MASTYGMGLTVGGGGGGGGRGRGLVIYPAADEDASPYVRLAAKHLTQSVLDKVPLEKAGEAAFAAASASVAAGETRASRRLFTGADLAAAQDAAEHAERDLKGGLAASFAFNFTRITRYIAAAICSALPVRAPPTQAQSSPSEKMPKGECGYCGETFMTTKAGEMRAHNDKATGKRCEGHGKPPARFI